MGRKKTISLKISAVFTSILLTSGSGFAGLNNYPNNFVENNKFSGEVVVGSEAKAIDTTSAQLVIDDLKNKFNDRENVYKVEFRSKKEDDRVSVTSRGDNLNYGNLIPQIVPSRNFNHRDTEFLAKEKFENDIENIDYEQEIELLGGEFNYALRDDVEGIEEISDNVFYEYGDMFASYTLEFDDGLEIGGDIDNFFGNLIGEEFKIMGEEFLVSGFDLGDTFFDSMSLLRGEDVLVLNQGDSVTLEYDNKKYDIDVAGIGLNSVNLIVEGEGKEIDLYESETVGNLNIGVSNILNVDAAGDSSAELFIGSEEIEISAVGDEVEKNGEEISDLYDDYYVFSNFLGSNTTGWEGFQVHYEADEDYLLEEGQSFNDPVFNSYGLNYTGTNNPDYSSIDLTSGGNDVEVSGELISGNNLARDFFYLEGFNEQEQDFFIQGDSEEERIYTGNSIINQTYSNRNLGNGVYYGENKISIKDTTGLNNSVSITVNNEMLEFDTDIDVSGDESSVAGNLTQELENRGILAKNEDEDVYFSAVIDNFDNASGNLSKDESDYGNSLVFDLNTRDVEGNGFLVTEDEDYQYLYMIDRVDTRSNEKKVDFVEIIEGREFDDVDKYSWGDDLETPIDNIELGDDRFNELFDENYVSVPLDSLRDDGGSYISFENGMIMDLSNVEVIGDSIENAVPNLDFRLDENYIDTSDDVMKNDMLNVLFSFDEDDEDVEIKIGGGTLVNDGIADISDSNSDIQRYVTMYGLMFEHESDEYSYLNVETPKEEVFGEYNLDFDSSGEGIHSVEVREENLDSFKEELNNRGFEIVNKELIEKEDIEMDVSSPTIDDEINSIEDNIVVGGPAVNKVARNLLDIEEYDYTEDAGVEKEEAIIEYFEDKNSVLVYGYNGSDTQKGIERLKEGSLKGERYNVYGN